MPQDPPVFGLVTTPAGHPLADAEVILRPGSTIQLAALGSLARTPAPVSGRTDSRGAYRLPAAAPGLVLVRHRDGLGALAPAFPGAAQRLVAEPMAALVSPGSPVRGWARGSWPGLGTGSLPVQEGEEIRLPAGQYRAWVESHGKLEFHRFTLVSGKQHRLPEPPEPELFLELWDGFRGRVIPYSWEETALIEVAANRFAVPAGASRLQIQEETPGGHVLIEVWHPEEPSVLRLEQPRRRDLAVRVQTRSGNPAAGTEVWALQSTAQGSRALGRVVTDPAGEAQLLLPDGVDVQLLAVDPVRAAAAADLEATARQAVLILGSSSRIQVAVEGPEGPGVAGARLELEPATGPWGRLVAHTDDRGLARFHRVPDGPVVVRLRDARYLPAEQVAAPGEGIRFRARRGRSVAGRALLPSGDPAVRALITLRNPRDERVMERTVASDDQGRFRITGLPDEAFLVLFGTLQLAGVTYSTRLSAVQPGDHECTLELQPEDPVPPNRRRRGR